jgi:DeoR family glycerol-3-phosphate regulon repressor
MEITTRQAKIRELIRDGSFLTVDDLSQRLKVAPQTIRRDVNALCDLGLARRRHGGVERPMGSGNLAYAARRMINQDAKQAIAQEVAHLVPSHATISFGIGTTPAVVADALLKHEGLMIYTNNLSAALTATANHSFEVHIAGGLIRNSDQDVTGSIAQDFFGQYKTDFGIFGVGGVDRDGCLLDFSEEEVRIREQIRQNCRHSVLVLDATKFQRDAHVRGGWIHEADTVVCDKPVPPAIERSLKNSGSQLIVTSRPDSK